MITNDILINYIKSYLKRNNYSSNELNRYINIFSRGEIFNRLLDYSDILLIILNYLSFDEIIDFGLIHKKYYKRLLSLDKLKIFIYKKFLQRKPSYVPFLHYFSLVENSSINKSIILSSLDKHTIFNLLPKYRYGDIIKYKFNYYFLCSNKLYLLNYNQDIYIYKELLDKFPLSYWQNSIYIFKIINVFIDSSHSNFDFDNIYIQEKYHNNFKYVKIYNKKYNIYIIIYLIYVSSNKKELIESVKEKINNVSYIYQVTDNQKYFSSFGYQNGNIKISYKIDNPLSGWYIE